MKKSQNWGKEESAIFSQKIKRKRPMAFSREKTTTILFRHSVLY
jgi:hypothetical protein